MAHVVCLHRPTCPCNYAAGEIPSDVELTIPFFRDEWAIREEVARLLVVMFAHLPKGRDDTAGLTKVEVIDESTRKRHPRRWHLTLRHGHHLISTTVPVSPIIGLARLYWPGQTGINVTLPCPPAVFDAMLPGDTPIGKRIDHGVTVLRARGLVRDGCEDVLDGVIRAAAQSEPALSADAR